MCLRTTVALVAWGAAALAQDLVTYDTVGVWDVLVDPTVGNDCLINAVFEDGSDVRVGFAPDSGFGNLLALNGKRTLTLFTQAREIMSIDLKDSLRAECRH